MEKEAEQNQSFFKENVRFGVKGAMSDIKALKAYFQMNPQSKMYIVEREEIEDTLPGEKRKVITGKYLEIRDNDGEEYNILIQIKMKGQMLTDNYPAVMVSKESNGVEGMEVFQPISQLKLMLSLERGYMKVVNKKEDTTEQELDERESFSNITRITKDMILSEEQRMINEQKESDRTDKDDQQGELYITQSNRDQFKRKLEQFIRLNDKNDLTMQQIKTMTKFRPISELENMVNELCYVEKNSKNAKIYKLKSK